jgi:crotonobetainyl-CoA:carnitine CoA-transferase CaiB-like acyl-CoA transferase
MKTCAGQQLVRQLASAADVVVENFLPGAASRMKISYDDVSKINPKAVYVSISGYGSSGPLAHHPVCRPALPFITCRSSSSALHSATAPGALFS